MVRVVEEAKPWSYEFACRKCTSRLEAKPEVVAYGEFGGSYGDSGEWKYYVTCPVCEFEVNFVPRDQPRAK